MKVGKRCYKCNHFKQLSEFYKEKRTKDGRRAECKICFLKRIKEYNQTEQGRKVHQKAKYNYNQSEKGKIAHRKNVQRYNQTAKGKANKQVRDKRFNARHPNLLKAKHAVMIAIRVGKLPRPDSLQCYYCPAQAKQYHHDKGYAPEHWLDVIPVCIPCHRKSKRKIA